VSGSLSPSLSLLVSPSLFLLSHFLFACPPGFACSDGVGSTSTRSAAGPPRPFCRRPELLCLYSAATMGSIAVITVQLGVRVLRHVIRFFDRLPPRPLLTLLPPLLLCWCRVPSSRVPFVASSALASAVLLSCTSRCAVISSCK
jgi:hypothetical protein